MARISSSRSPAPGPAGGKETVVGRGPGQRRLECSRFGFSCWLLPRVFNGAAGLADLIKAIAGLTPRSLLQRGDRAGAFGKPRDFRILLTDEGPQPGRCGGSAIRHAQNGEDFIERTGSHASFTISERLVKMPKIHRPHIVWFTAGVITPPRYIKTVIPFSSKNYQTFSCSRRKATGLSQAAFAQRAAWV